MRTATFEKQKLTPPEVAQLWGVSVEKILSFIRSGELRAINAASPGRSQRPRFLVDVADLEDFERRRATAPSPAKSPRRFGRAERHPDDRY